MKSYTPLRYPGGKSKLYDFTVKIIKENFYDLPVYIEPFAGGSGLALKLLTNKIVRKIYINDYDYSVYCFWYAIKYHNREFIEMINNCVISIEERERQKKIYKSAKSKKYSKLQIGFSTFYLNRTNRSGIITAGVIGGINQNGNYKIDCRFNKTELIRIIKNINKLKKNIHVYNRDGKKFIKQMDKKFDGDAIFYLDPPYVDNGPDLYKNSFILKDHRELSESIKTLENKWFLTYDKKDVIRNLYTEFRINTLALNYSVQTKRKGEEYIIYSDNILI